MTPVLLGLGSNLQRHRHIGAGLDALAQRFGPLAISPVFESLPVGCGGQNYFNLVVAIETRLSLRGLSLWLKQLEDRFGRDRAPGRVRTLDIDILTYGTLTGLVDGVQLPRAEILRNAFVLWPLAELVPQQLHPQQGRSYRELWQAYSGAQRLWPVDFDWAGGRISHADPHCLSCFRAEFALPADTAATGAAPAPHPTPSL